MLIPIPILIPHCGIDIVTSLKPNSKKNLKNRTSFVTPTLGYILKPARVSQHLKWRRRLEPTKTYVLNFNLKLSLERLKISNGSFYHEVPSPGYVYPERFVKIGYFKAKMKFWMRARP